MSFKTKMLAGAATLAMVGGVGTAGALSAGPANAATPSCGPGGINPITQTLSGCIDVFSKQFGTHRHPNFVLDVFRQGAKVGQPIILFRDSNSDPAEDFTVSDQGSVSDFLAAGLVSPSVALHYGGGTANSVDDEAFELEYAPNGVDTGLCVGVAATASQNQGVTLQGCGLTAKTVWIVDTYDISLPASFHGYFPLINGSDTNFSHPFVLTYPSNGYPTDKPRPQLQVRNLTGFSNGFGPVVGTVPNTQEWSAVFGVLNN